MIDVGGGGKRFVTGQEGEPVPEKKAEDTLAKPAAKQAAAKPAAKAKTTAPERAESEAFWQPAGGPRRDKKKKRKTPAEGVIQPPVRDPRPPPPSGGGRGYARAVTQGGRGTGGRGERVVGGKAQLRPEPGPQKREEYKEKRKRKKVTRDGGEIYIEISDDDEGHIGDMGRQSVDE